jgi:hypothetical protein
LSRAPEWCYTRVGSCHTSKHYNILETLARNENSSLLRTFATYDRKKFHNIATNRYSPYETAELDGEDDHQVQGQML